VRIRGSLSDGTRGWSNAVAAASEDGGRSGACIHEEIRALAVQRDGKRLARRGIWSRGGYSWWRWRKIWSAITFLIFRMRSGGGVGRMGCSRG
jgi:hypothetical protein